MKTSADAGTCGAALTSAINVSDDLAGDVTRSPAGAAADGIVTAAADGSAAADGVASGWESLDGSLAAEGDPAAGRLAGMRRRVDIWLAEMVSDDPVQDGSEAPWVTASAGAGGAAGGHQSAGLPVFASTVFAGTVAPGSEPVPAPAGPDSGFWGPGESGDAKSTSGYQSKHRLTGPAKEPKPAEGRRGKPKHAAPPSGFGTSLADSIGRRAGRTVAAARLATSRAARGARDRSGESAPAAGLGTRPAAVG